MTIENSGLTAGGRAHPEIRPGDKWKDSRGGIVIIESYRFDKEIVTLVNGLKFELFRSRSVLLKSEYSRILFNLYFNLRE
ncbi:hypothetical protein ACWKBE_004260 [Enterobacter hormaechei]|uniref:hypothetical protein n=1 Tax=Enterobacter hormaechei TaxID=158836 RepID=UPI0020216307|nr:hypothetical protein [Enterobacter hormaechei]MCL8101311.1 hypothetical protein [Enterobacter hormaechei]MCM8028238.1 hypothetical protein [Enterobacter hormaechei]MCM8047484.1 hypothetical protein [Enterobacter hormaechei]